MSTILVVDDDADTCRNMADLFGDVGYAIETAESGQTALTKARQTRYDIALLDLRMPGMDGLSLCRHLKRLQPRMGAILVTAYGDCDVNEQARAAGALLVILKPVDFSLLLAAVESSLTGLRSNGTERRHKPQFVQRSFALNRKTYSLTTCGVR